MCQRPPESPAFHTAFVHSIKLFKTPNEICFKFESLINQALSLQTNATVKSLLAAAVPVSSRAWGASSLQGTSSFYRCSPQSAHSAWQATLHTPPAWGARPSSSLTGRHSGAPDGGSTYLQSVKRTVSSLWEATITSALVSRFSSSRMWLRHLGRGLRERPRQAQGQPVSLLLQGAPTAASPHVRKERQRPAGPGLEEIKAGDAGLPVCRGVSRAPSGSEDSWAGCSFSDHLQQHVAVSPPMGTTDEACVSLCCSRQTAPTLGAPRDQLTNTGAPQTDRGGSGHTCLETPEQGAKCGPTAARGPAARTAAPPEGGRQGRAGSRGRRARH